MRPDPSRRSAPGTHWRSGTGRKLATSQGRQAHPGEAHRGRSRRPRSGGSHPPPPRREPTTARYLSSQSAYRHIHLLASALARVVPGICGCAYHHQFCWGQLTGSWRSRQRHRDAGAWFHNSTMDFTWALGVALAFAVDAAEDGLARDPPSETGDIGGRVGAGGVGGCHGAGLPPWQPIATPAPDHCQTPVRAENPVHVMRPGDIR
jgi:hypothetical protein